MEWLLANLMTFGSIVLLDIVLSGDNAVIIGAKAASLPAEQRKKVIKYGMFMAAGFRIVLLFLATYLLQIPGIRLAGGLALLYVAWGMFKDIRDNGIVDGSTENVTAAANYRSALFAVALADLSMSIDNILAVAGAAGDHYFALIFGIVLSIFIMIFAANAVARLIEKYRWLAWFGLLLVLYIAGHLIYQDVPVIVSWTS
jgi:YjbE family integral membrane protein